MEKKQFESVKLQTVLLQSQDVITTSGGVTAVKGEYDAEGNWNGLQNADGTNG